MSKEAYRRLRDLEEKLDAVELAFNIQQGEANAIARDIENLALSLLEEAVEKKVEQIFDKKIALVDSMEKKFSEKLAIVNSRISEAFDKANGPVPTVEMPPKQPKPKPLTALQQRRMDVLVKFMKMKGTPVNRKQILEWAWQDVPKSSANALLKLACERNLIELWEPNGPPPRHYILKKKKPMSGLHSKIEPFLNSNPETTGKTGQPVSPKEYFGDDLRDF